MADNRREQERAELYKSIWAIANDLRGSVDGWDFKNYVLTMLFYRYISENLTNYINKGEREAGDSEFDYAMLSDEEAEGARDGLIEEKGFFILPSELFCNVVAKARQDENLNETLETIFRNIEDSANGTEQRIRRRERREDQASSRLRRAGSCAACQVPAWCRYSG